MKYTYKAALYVITSVILFSNADTAMTSTTINSGGKPACTEDAPKKIDPKFYKWPYSNIDPYHGNPKKYYNKPLLFCPGQADQNKDIINIWPTWPYAIREEWYYPITIIDTVAGVLTFRGSQLTGDILLNGKPFIKDIGGVSFQSAYPEDTGKPQIIIISGLQGREPATIYDTAPSRLIDMGASPPYLVPTILKIFSKGSDDTQNSRHDLEEELGIPWSHDTQIHKVDEGHYIISGWTTKDALDGNHDLNSYESLPIRYEYNRKNRSISILK